MKADEGSFESTLVHLAELVGAAESIEDGRSILIGLLRGLGFPEDTIWLDYDVAYATGWSFADVAVGPPGGQPWLLGYSGIGREDLGLTVLFSRLRNLCRSAGVEGALAITKDSLVFIHESGESSTRVEFANTHGADKLWRALNASQFLGRPVKARAQIRRSRIGPNPHFAIDCQVVRKYLDQLDAGPAAARGRCLEALARVLLRGIRGVVIRERNLRTRTGEIDVLCRVVEPAPGMFFECLASPYFLVECKNWEKPVGAKEVRVLESKMAEARVDFGILFAKAGITGRNGEDALGCVQRLWDTSGSVVVVVSLSELEMISQGRDFYALLEARYEERRFGKKGIVEAGVG